MENDTREHVAKVGENDQTKRYYVDFYDMFDGWGGFGFFTERLFDELSDATKLCDKLNGELAEGNRKCGEHYGVIDSKINREVYCGLDEKYRTKISDLKEHLSKLDEPKLEKKDRNVDKPNDRYQEVAEEIAYVIKDELFDSSEFDADQIAEVLKRRFNVMSEDTGRILMTDVAMFYVYSGNTFTIPMFGVLAFARLDIKPIISGKCYPNYDIRNKYIGYTEDGLFHKVNWQTSFIDSIKRNPYVVFAGIIAGYSVAYTILHI